MVDREDAELNVGVTQLPPLAALEQQWRTLEQQSDCSVFVTWAWIGTWLRLFGDLSNIRLLVITRAGEVVGLAVLCNARPRRHLLWAPRTLSLHTACDAVLDHVFIEYNGVLAKRGMEAVVWQACCKHLQSCDREWDEFYLAGVSRHLLGCWPLERYSLRTEVSRPVRRVNLETVRGGEAKFIETLSQSARRSIKQTLKALNATSLPAVRAAASVDEARRYFALFARLHQQRWSGKQGGGAFDIPSFERFHRDLIEHHFDSGVIQLLLVGEESDPLGVIYNFVHRDSVMQYQSGFNYAATATKATSPGLVAHVAAIEFCLQAGFRVYDMLAGDNQLKRTLANESDELWWGAVQRRTMSLGLERVAASAWRRVRGAVQGRLWPGQEARAAQRAG